MSAMRLSAKMDRTDLGTPWGFRMTGGKDFGAPLVIQRVSHETSSDFLRYSTRTLGLVK